MYPDLLANGSAAYKAHHYGEAKAFYERCVALNPVAGRAWDDLGLASMRCGQFPRAVVAFHKYAEIGAGPPSSSAYNLGCTYALWNKKDMAFKWLQLALDRGWRSVQDMSNDEDLASLRTDPRFAKMVGSVDKARMGRVEGLRFDLEFLKSELFRRHYEPFRLHSKKEFDDAFDRLNRNLSQLNDDQVWVGMQRIMAMVGDAHTSLYYRVLHGESPDMLPIDMAYLDGHLVIQAAEPRYADLVGGDVLSIEGVAVSECYRRMTPYISKDNSLWPDHIFRLLARNLRFLHGVGLARTNESVDFRIRLKSGEERIATLQPGQKAPYEAWRTIEEVYMVPTPLYRQESKTPYRAQLIDEGHTLYLKYNEVTDVSTNPWTSFLDGLFAEIESGPVENLIIDMRDNGGGQGELVSALTTHVIKSRVDRPGHLFVVTGRKSVSAALTSIGQLMQYTDAIMVGEPTGSSPNFIGEAVQLTLPYSGFEGSISDVFHQTSSALDHSPWYAPTIYAPPTIDALRTGTDPALVAIEGYMASHR